MKSWKILTKGDVVDIVAPSSGVSNDEIEKVRALLISWGLNPSIPEDLLGDDLLCSNSDEKRFQQLQSALFNSTSKAVWYIRGGYGTTRLISQLDQLAAPSKSKIMIGFSDATALHIFLQQKWGWPTLHGASARQTAIEEVDHQSRELLKTILFGQEKKIDYSHLLPLNTLAKKELTFESVVTGGNLSLIQASLGTSWQLNTKDKIILLEDWRERGYCIDRKLTQLQQAGIFSEAKAVILGDFIGGEEADGTSKVDVVLERFVQEIKLPVLKCAGVGHGEVNLPVPLGIPASLKMGERSSLSFIL
jgi:muramoyltetrapeptide carboxypeptidase